MKMDSPANYRIIVRNAAGFNLAFSDNDGLADDFGAIRRRGGFDLEPPVAFGTAGFRCIDQINTQVVVGCAIGYMKTIRVAGLAIYETQVF